MMTFDNEEELYKISKNCPDAQVIIRILADDSKSVCRFGIKFGADKSSIGLLVSKCRELGLNLVGVSFHVGSGCFDPLAYDDAISRAKFVFDLAKEYGFDLKVLDIGGGFPSSLFQLAHQSFMGFLEQPCRLKHGTPLLSMQRHVYLMRPSMFIILMLLIPLGSY